MSGPVEEHDRRVLGQVARVLDGPRRGGSRGPCRPPSRGGTGSRRPGGGPGRSCRRCRRAAAPTGMSAPSPADQLRRHHAAAAADEHEERRRERRRSGGPSPASPNRRPATNWRGDRPRRRSSPAAAAARGGGDVVGVVEARLVVLRPPDRAPRARPTASIVRPTATMWAWYQVVASWAAYQKTVPKAKKIVVASRTARSTRSRPSIHQQSADVDGGEGREQRWSSVARPAQRHERQQDDAPGSGGKGSRPRGTPSDETTGRTSWKNQLPTDARPCLDRVADGRPGPRGTPRPATRSGRSTRSIRVAR